MSAVLSQPGGAAASLAIHGDVGAVRAVTEQTPLISDAENHAALRNGEDGSGGYEEEGWNDSKINVARYMCTNITFLVMGMNDACVGALIPYIEDYYDISHTAVSTLFIVPFFGYLVAALSNSWLHYTIGQRGIAFFGALCRLIGYVPLALHPSYFPLLPVVMLFTGFGNGINDSAWNAYVGNLRGPNELLGVLHGVYGLGGTIAPLVASVMVAKLSLGWYTYFYLMIAISCVELVTGVTAFWAATGADYRKKLRFEGGRKPMTTTALLRSPIAWLVSAFLFGYVGVEVCLGGWIPTFMLEVRHTDGFVAGLTVTLFWFALTLGRVALGFVTGRIGEKMAVTVYLCLCIIMQIVYWVVPDFAVSIVAVVLLGFFLGPLYPGVIAALTKLLPRDQHVATIGFASAIGGGGAALFPFLVGALAEDNGVQVLQPFVVALLAVIVLLWLAVPGGLMQGGLEKARENNEAVGSRLWRIFSAGKD